ncbi:MAG: hypothetical protein KatS3mg031_2684 [Chitinophagales bacterium]|nr:MAG: hypothetical protein KatS3mg031_2684 [Chitinophagales bacterium]
MYTLITWLKNRKMLTATLVAVYMVFILVMHDTFVALSVWIMEKINADRYNLAVAIGSFSVLALLVWYVKKKLRHYRQSSGIKTAFFTAMICLIILHMQALFVVNIEIIHAFQFGFLALLIYPLTQSHGRTMFYCTLLGALDEFFQYKVWHSLGADYFDFNDIVINQLGIGIALVLISIAGVPTRPLDVKQWYRLPELHITALLAIAITWMLQTGRMELYARGTGQAWLTLSKYPDPLPFWLQLRNSDIIYHVLTPTEGLIIVFLIIAMFYLYDRLLMRQHFLQFSLNGSATSAPGGQVKRIFPSKAR